jgi:hypothetical protein
LDFTAAIKESGGRYYPTLRMWWHNPQEGRSGPPCNTLGEAKECAWHYFQDALDEWNRREEPHVEVKTEMDMT